MRRKIKVEKRFTNKAIIVGYVISRTEGDARDYLSVIYINLGKE